MDFDLLHLYFSRSLDAINEGPTEDFHLSIANSVLWACILDDALKTTFGQSYVAARDASHEGRALSALRIARNAIVHGQTYGLHDGHPWPVDGEPLFMGPPVWKTYDELRETWTPDREPSVRLREMYEHEIAGTHIGSPLWAARDWLDPLAESGWRIA